MQGRNPHAGEWFQTRPVGVVCALLLTGVALIGLVLLQYMQSTVLQRAYLPMYIRAVASNAINLSTSGRYTLWMVRYRDGHEFLALDTDIAQASEHESGVQPSHDGALVEAASRYRHQDIVLWLQRAIFPDAAPLDMVRTILMRAGGFGFVALIGGFILDRRRARARRQGRRVKGPEDVSPGEFTGRINKGTWA